VTPKSREVASPLHVAAGKMQKSLGNGRCEPAAKFIRMRLKIVALAACGPLHRPFAFELVDLGFDGLASHLPQKATPAHDARDLGPRARNEQTEVPLAAIPGREDATIANQLIGHPK